MTDVEIRRKLRARSIRAIDLQQKITRKSATQNAHRKTRHADSRREQHAAENNSDVVDERSERANHKLPFGILHGAEDTAVTRGELSERGDHDLPLDSLHGA